MEIVSKCLPSSNLICSFWQNGRFQQIRPYPFPLPYVMNQHQKKKVPPFDFSVLYVPISCKDFSFTLQLQSIISICCRCYRMLLLKLSTKFLHIFVCLRQTPCTIENENAMRRGEHPRS